MEESNIQETQHRDAQQMRVDEFAAMLDQVRQGNKDLIPQAHRYAIVQMILGIAKRVGADTTRESSMNIPIGMLMDVLVGDSMHIGSLIGLNTEDPECVVMRVEMKDEPDLRDALLKCFPGIYIEVDEDVEDMVPWPFE